MEVREAFRGKGALQRALALPRGLAGSPARPFALWPAFLALWEEERQARRPFLWLAPLAILGALLYAAADSEPSLIASCAPLVLWSSLAFVFRRGSVVASQSMIALAAIAAGFLFAGLKTQFVAAPILMQSESGKLHAIIEQVDVQVQDARMILRPIMFNGRTDALPERVRVRGPRGFHAGDHIIANAHLMPPPEEARPGGYDFARDAFFKSIGAVGSLNGPIETKRDAIDLPLKLRFAISIDNLRNRIANRIYTVIGGQSGAVAAALITGKRGMISDESNEDLRGAGIYHVVSISGLHMVLAAGMIFFLLRLLLGLIPRIALHYPIKELAAAGAMCGAFAYNIFAGSEVATERSLIMTLFLFGAILVGRPALSMRNLAFAALLVVMIEPDSVTGPSFQMSFAAVAALVAVFERRAPIHESIRQAPIEFVRQEKAAPLTWPERVAYFLFRHARIVLVTTLIAEAATAPYAAFHFQRFQPLGLIGNALSIPLIELVSMPLGFMGLLAMPFGLDAPFWQLMGYGVDPMLIVAQWVASLPAATRALPAISVFAALILTFGLVWLALWSSALRFLGMIPVTLGILMGLVHDKPDLFIARDGQSVALRMSDGKLHVMGKGASDFIIAQWLSADGDLRKADDASIRAGPMCNRSGCVAKLYDGRRVVITYFADDLVEDCSFASILVTPLDAPQSCKAFVIDQITTERHGAVALTITKQKINLTGARDPMTERPWILKRGTEASDDMIAP